MTSKKILSWFLTDSGRNFSGLAIGGVTTGLMIAQFLPHTLLLEKYKNFVHLYRKGFTVNLPPKVIERFKKTLDILELHEMDKILFKPFPVYGFDVFSAGSIYSKFGVIVGLPANFAYDSVDDIDKDIIKVANGSSIDWHSETGELLQKSLVLSENAQMYAMAREIKFRQTIKPMLDIVVTTGSILTAYVLGHHLNVKYNLYIKPLPLRLVMYSLVSLFFGVNYFTVKDMSQLYYEETHDKELMKLNPIFAEGGKEFYAKTLQRNIALRKLLGSQGEKMYSVLGNENYFIRVKHLPLVQRKMLFEQSSS